VENGCGEGTQSKAVPLLRGPTCLSKSAADKEKKYEPTIQLMPSNRLPACSAFIKEAERQRLASGTII
jgi:hypothetical protein